LGDDFQVVFAESGEQAAQLCAKIKPDLVLMETVTPRMDGFAALARLRGQFSPEQLPVIFYTEHADPETERRAFEAGVADFIAKPCSRAVFAHRVNLQYRLAQQQYHLENTIKHLEDSITFFSDMIEFRDESIGGHAQRTTAYTGLLTGELLREGAFADELDPEVAEMIERAAPLHDVGKIGIRDVILLKPALLDDEEFGIVKSHTSIGGKILRYMYSSSSQPYLEYAIKIAEEHHERFDGKGYPARRRGNEISLCARIVSLADVYDALTDTRTYKKPMSYADACRIITAGAGRQFDPVIVQAFNAVKPAFWEIAQAGGSGLTPSYLQASLRAGGPEF
jgi:putative two-component system response regulator